MSLTIIKDIKARKVIDTRAEYTIEVDVLTAGGGFGRSAAPLSAPASRGIWEVPAYPPGGVDEAVKIVNEVIKKKLVGMDALNQALIDKTLKEVDGTDNFSKIGGNTATVISIAVAKAAASTLGLPLYRYLGGPFQRELSIPIANIIGGGPHARKGKAPDFQEHQVIPINAKNIKEAIIAVVEAYKKAKKYCEQKDPNFTGGGDDEAAWVPSLTDRDVLEILAKICEEIESELGVKMRIGLDCAAENLWDSKEKVYVYYREGTKRDPGEQLEYISELIKTFPIYYVEDFVHDNDFESYVELTKKFGKRMLICGDDLFACEYNRLLKGIEMGAANSIIIKVNMRGTLTDTFETVRLAHEHGYVPIKSCRSGETEDTAISHLAVAWNCPFNKFAVGGKGATKLNELIRIEEELGKEARMPKLRIRPD